MKQATLIYDGECPFCRRAAAWVLRRARPGAIEALPCQDRERERRFPGITFEKCMAAMHLVTHDGQVFAGEAALPPLMERLRGWRWLAAVLRWPGIRHASPAVYRWFARHRYALAGLAGHPRGESCTTDPTESRNERKKRD